MTLGVSHPLRMHSSCSSCRLAANSSAISFWYVSRDFTRTPHCSLYSSIRSRQSKMSRSTRSSAGTMREPPKVSPPFWGSRIVPAEEGRRDLGRLADAAWRHVGHRGQLLPRCPLGAGHHHAPVQVRLAAELLVQL